MSAIDRLHDVVTENDRRLEATIAGLRTILADRERELLEIKGPCSNGACRLHYAHSGPCDTRTDR
jgi:hypothetical protein